MAAAFCAGRVLNLPLKMSAGWQKSSYFAHLKKHNHFASILVRDLTNACFNVLFTYTWNKIILLFQKLESFLAWGIPVFCA